MSGTAIGEAGVLDQTYWLAKIAPLLLDGQLKQQYIFAVARGSLAPIVPFIPLLRIVVHGYLLWISVRVTFLILSSLLRMSFVNTVFQGLSSICSYIIGATADCHKDVACRVAKIFSVLIPTVIYLLQNYSQLLPGLLNRTERRFGNSGL